MWISAFWEKVMMNTTHMFMNQEKHYIIEAQDNFLKWSETKALALLNSESIAKFLWKKIICWYECFQKLICDEKSENKNVIKILAKKYEIQFILKINTNILIAQLNKTASNLSEALITHWIIWIQFFDFIMQHVSDMKHQAADELL